MKPGTLAARELRGGRADPRIKENGMSKLTAKIERFEKKFGVDKKYVFMPIPGRPEQVMRLPRRFVEFMAEMAEKHAAEGDCRNVTDAISRGETVDDKR